MAAMLALLPIALLVGLMAGLRWSAAVAGLVCALVTAVVAILGFGHGADGLAPALLGPAAEAAFTALSIVWIVFGALALHEYQLRGGGIAALGRWLAGFGGDRRVAALLVAWFFALFLEGAAGFGTPVALAAPLLVGLGFPPATALVMVLVGHAAGVSFGALGTPMVPLLAAARVDPAALSLAILLLHAALAWALLALVLRFAGARRTGPWVLAGTALFFLPAALLAWWVGPELPTLGGALVGAGLFVLLVRRKGGGGADGGGRDLLRAALPYLFAVALVLATRLVPPVREALGGVTLGWTLPGGYAGEVAPLFHPGTLLVAALVLAAAVRPGGAAMLLPSARGAAARLPRVLLALVAVLLVARLMAHSGMIAALAEGAGRALGPAWPLAAPLAAAAGSFVTGSATASNILLADLQIEIAAAAGLSPLLVAAAQGFGAAIGNIVAPHNIVAGAATVGLTGSEGKVLKRTLPVCLLYAAAGGALLLAAQAAWS
ncbi:MAG: L-lactate permease [Allosphingosinicella sp.]|uniref:L-lactate permease n=1 Tax=Allosphingosinicella sp. TaxID=2823234 RepID=UPI003941490C